jgi:hypothetical protein
VTVRVSLGFQTASGEDANSMGDALAALESPSSSSPAKSVLTAAGMSITGVGTDGQCSPPHRMPCNRRIEGSNFV